MENNFLIYYMCIIIILILYLTICPHPELYSNSILNNNFDIYVINLPSSKERLVHFMNQYNNSDLVSTHINVFSAVNGKTLELEKYVTAKAYEQILLTEKTSKRKYHYELSSYGAIGCYLSHINTWKEIIKNYANILSL
jgi:GR25 family glycosyltransferase involved in LPS biosynthesis